MSRNPFIMINARNLRNYMSINVVFTGKHSYYGLYAEFSMVKRPFSCTFLYGIGIKRRFSMNYNHELRIVYLLIQRLKSKTLHLYLHVLCF